MQNFGNFQLTGSPTDGFNAGKIIELQHQRRREQIGNRVYTVIPLAMPLEAIKTGELAVGRSPPTWCCAAGQNQGGDPFMRQFFNQGEQRQVTLASEPVIVKSLPLPEENRPANFTGAVGDFTMIATAGPTNVTVGEPITVRVQISGRGALGAVTLPLQDAWQDFKTYPPTTKLDTTDQFGFQGTKTFEQIISPLNSDVHELPPLAFSFFNPNDGSIPPAHASRIPLTIHAAGARQCRQLSEIKIPRQKINCLKTLFRSRKILAPM
ncbi:MAG: BatD family protein [Limisphaerales bacterium]